MKFCKDCNRKRPLSAFTNNKNKPDGKQDLCKPHYNEFLRQYYRSRPAESASRSKNSFEKYYLTLNGRACHMLNNARRRAKVNGLEFTLEKDWLIQKLVKGVCEITKLPFELNINGGKGHRTNSFSPSLDRIDGAKGYIPENIQVVCWIYNRAKGAFPIEDLITMARTL